MIFYLFLFCHWTLHPGSQWTRWWGAASPGDLTPWLMLMIWALWPELGERRKPGEPLTWDHCYHVTSPHQWSPIHHPRTHTTLHTLFFPKAIYNVCDNNTPTQLDNNRYLYPSPVTIMWVRPGETVVISRVSVSACGGYPSQSSLSPHHSWLPIFQTMSRQEIKVVFVLLRAYCFNDEYFRGFLIVQHSAVPQWWVRHQWYQCQDWSLHHQHRVHRQLWSRVRNMCFWIRR